MADVDHIENLKKVRASLVEQRRTHAAYENIKTIVEIQDKIEAIDRAIADEVALTQSGHEPSLRVL